MNNFGLPIRNWWHNTLNANELYEEWLYPLARRSVKRQFLAQVTNPKVFVIASFTLKLALAYRSLASQRAGNGERDAIDPAPRTAIGCSKFDRMGFAGREAWNISCRM